VQLLGIKRDSQQRIVGIEPREDNIRAALEAR